MSAEKVALKEWPTVELQARYDSTLKQIEELQSTLPELVAELSRRQNARTYVINQVISGHDAVLLEVGVPAETIASAKEFVRAQKEQKAARATAESATEGGAS